MIDRGYAHMSAYGTQLCTPNRDIGDIGDIGEIKDITYHRRPLKSPDNPLQIPNIFLSFEMSCDNYDRAKVHVIS